MSYLRYLCLFAHSDVRHIMCCVFYFLCLRLASCVPNVGLFILDLRVSLTFMYTRKISWFSPDKCPPVKLTP